MRRKDTEITLKRGFSGMLSAAIVVSQLVSGGMTALAYTPPTDPLTITYSAGEDATATYVVPDGGFKTTAETIGTIDDLQAFTTEAIPNDAEKEGYQAEGYIITSGTVYATDDENLAVDAEGSPNALTGTLDAGEQYVANTNVTLTINWVARTYSVLGLGNDPVTKTYGEDIEITEPSEDGTTFNGWTIGEDTTVISTAELNDALDVAFVADNYPVSLTVAPDVNENEYTVTFKTFDGKNDSVVNEATFAYGGALTIYPSDEIPEDLIFDGWATEAGADDFEIADGAEIADITGWVSDEENAYKKSITLYEVWSLSDIGKAIAATEGANETASEAKDAAEAADKAAAAAEKNPTDATVKAAKEAAAEATEAAEKALEAAEAALKAAEKVSGSVADDAEKAAEAATKAAEAAKASAKKATDAATAAQKKIDDAKAAEEAAKKSDGSTKEAPAPKGNALKDAAGKETGFVVTNDDAKNPEVKYVGTEADKTAEDVKVDTAVDQNGHVYKVTEIAEGALQNATGKNLTIGKSVKKIGKNACKGAKFKKITIKTDKKGKVTIGKGAFKVKNKKCVIKVKGAKGKNKTKLIKKIKKQASKGVTVK